MRKRRGGRGGGRRGGGPVLRPARHQHTLKRRRVRLLPGGGGRPLFVARPERQRPGVDRRRTRAHVWAVRLARRGIADGARPLAPAARPVACLSPRAAPGPTLPPTGWRTAAEATPKWSEVAMTSARARSINNGTSASKTAGLSLAPWGDVAVMRVLQAGGCGARSPAPTRQTRPNATR